jgi:hypothetical protein
LIEDRWEGEVEKQGTEEGKGGKDREGRKEFETGSRS